MIGAYDNLQTNNVLQTLNHSDGGVHLIFSEYDLPPSETEIEFSEQYQYPWIPTEPMSNFYYNHMPHTTNNYCSFKEGNEVHLVYSDYDEPKSETDVDVDCLFQDTKITGHELTLVYSEYEEPSSETDVEYDGRLWCSIFGNPEQWKVREEGREVNLIYSEYSYAKSETSVQMLSHLEPININHDYCFGEPIEISENETITTAHEKVDELLSSDESTVNTARTASFYFEAKYDSDVYQVTDNIYTAFPSPFSMPNVEDSLMTVGKVPIRSVPMENLPPIWYEKIGDDDQNLKDDSELLIENADEATDQNSKTKTAITVRNIDKLDKLLQFTAVSDATVDEDNNMHARNNDITPIQSLRTGISVESIKQFSEKLDELDSDISADSASI